MLKPMPEEAAEILAELFMLRILNLPAEDLDSTWDDYVIVLVAKVVGAPGYPTGAQLVEAVQKGVKGVSAKEKQLSGGKHKFDPSEVDVHGGSATADDFMDAFGF